MPEHREPPTVMQMIEAGMSHHDALEARDCIDRHPEKDVELWWLWITECEGNA